MYLVPGTPRVAVLSESLSMGWGDCPPGAVCAAMAIAPGPNQPAVVWVDLLDTTAAAAPRWDLRLRFEGRLVDSRRIGNALVLVTHHQAPIVNQVLPLDAEARAALVAKLGAADVLPHLTRNGGASAPLVAETDCYLQSGNSSTDVGVTTLSVIDLADPAHSVRSRCVLGGTEAVYMSPANLYLATTRWSYNATTYASSTTTDLHKFAINAWMPPTTAAPPKCPATWAGTPEMKSYRMSEHQGDLRVLTYTGDTGWGLPDADGGRQHRGGHAVRRRIPRRRCTILHETRQREAPAARGPVAQRPAARGAGQAG